MAALYAACPGWEGGWSDKGKRRELAHDDARFLLAAAAAPDEGGGAGTLAAAAPADGGASPPAPAPVALPPGAPLAFVHLRFEEERGAPVAYVYEIQVEGAAQGRGVGRFLMQAVELVARQRGLAAVMLTVFRANAAAGAMYRALGYVSDASSPAEREGAGYEILSKRLPPPRAAAPAAAGAAAAALAGA
jgi:ribosomal protein S18 acetylase RimI-like enzyme